MTDVQFLAHESLAAFQVKTRTSHRRKQINVLFADGHVTTAGNQDNALTVDIGNVPYGGLVQILDVFEKADELR